MHTFWRWVLFVGVVHYCVEHVLYLDGFFFVFLWCRTPREKRVEHLFAVRVESSQRMLVLK